MGIIKWTFGCVAAFRNWRKEQRIRRINAIPYGFNLGYPTGSCNDGSTVIQLRKGTEMKKPVFDQKQKHVLVFRHGPRAVVPPPGNVWDYYMMLRADAQQIAQRTIAAYFPELMPVALRCSQIPRSAQTLGFLWPALVSQIRLDRRLGNEFEEIGLWAPIDAYADAYDMLPQRQFEIQPDLVTKSGQGLFDAAKDLALEISLGKVGALCSHMPFADMCARLARLELGISENDGWLPGSGFGSGAFVHLAFDASGNIASCEYYPVPSA